MGRDLEVSMGFEDKEFVASLKRHGGYAKKKGWQIVKDFERQEKAKVRAAELAEAKIRAQRGKTFYGSKRQSAQVAKNLKLVGGVARVAGSAISAGFVAGAFALQKAAERSEDVRRELERVGAAKDNFVADIGDDLAPLIGGLDDIIDRAGKARGSMVDFFAMFGSNESDVNNKNRILQGIKQGDQRFADEKKASQIRNDFLGGSEDDPDRKKRTDRNKAINEIKDPLMRKKLREESIEQDAKEKAKKLKEEQKKQAESNRRYAQRNLDLDADAAEAKSARNPNDLAAKREAIKARSRANINRSADEVNSDNTLSQNEKDEINRQKQSTINQQTAKELEDARRESEMTVKAKQEESDLEQKRLADLARENAMKREMQKVDLSRAKGNEREADARALILEYEERLQQIREQEGLSEEERAELNAQEQRIFDAKSEKLNEGDGPDGPGTLGPGFGGDATTAAQAIGVRSEGRELININNLQRETLERIATAVEKGTGATVQ